MSKRFISTIGIIFSLTVLASVHLYSPVVRGLAFQASHAHQHASDYSCQTVCQAINVRESSRSLHVEKEDDRPTSPVPLEVIPVEVMGVGLLKEGGIWRHSSWVPPDIPLLSGYYSSGLESIVFSCAFNLRKGLI